MKKFLVPMAVSMGIVLAGLFLLEAGWVLPWAQPLALVAVLGGLVVQHLLERRAE